ncbi:discoidin domain-containing protein [Streptomyces sp. NPDC059456]|uniref:discoidin domain-containing protein n=1 Tax=Streptomyces sp. NPDC059456 TaxID=3346838 RepID=UPI003683861E
MAQQTWGSPKPAATDGDGDGGTRWSSAYTDPQWLRVDRGSSRAIGRVVPRREAAYRKALRIHVSDDAATWRTAYSTTTGAGRVRELTGFSGPDRYVRVYGGLLSGSRTAGAAGKALDGAAASRGTPCPRGALCGRWSIHSTPTSVSRRSPA